MSHSYLHQASRSKSSGSLLLDACSIIIAPVLSQNLQVQQSLFPTLRCHSDHLVQADSADILCTGVVQHHLRSISTGEVKKSITGMAEDSEFLAILELLRGLAAVAAQRDHSRLSDGSLHLSRVGWERFHASYTEAHGQVLTHAWLQVSTQDRVLSSTERSGIGDGEKTTV